MKPLLLVPLLAGLLAVAALTSGSGPQPAGADACQTPLVFGDMSGDHTVQATDALYVLRDVAKMVNIGWCAPLDVDCNGSITAVDTLKILRYVAGMPYSQDEPRPNIGTVLDGPGFVPNIACGSTRFGDVSGNDLVDSPDAIWILRKIADLPLPEGGDGCASQDVDCDGDRDAVDALKILRYVAGMPDTQSEPCPDIGSALEP
jgi:hypothetical protein